MSLDIFFFFISSLPCQGNEDVVDTYNLFGLGRLLPGKQLATCLFLGLTANFIYIPAEV